MVKARNKLDGRSYAISEERTVHRDEPKLTLGPPAEKVKLRPEDNEQKVYREVNSLSRVSHHHIVRYYGCWLEDATPPEISQIVSQPPSSGPTPSTTTSSEEEDIFATNFDDLSFSRRDQSRSASFPRIRFANSGDDDDVDDDDDESDSADSSDDNESDAETAADPSDLRGRAAISKPMTVPPKPSMSLTGTSTDGGSVQRILYIQMEFVEKVSIALALADGNWLIASSKR